MDIDISFTVGYWGNIKSQLQNGELDVLPLVSYTEERDEYLDFSAPYIVMHGNIFIRNGNSIIHTEDDLYGKEIIVMRDDNAHEYAVRMGFTDNLILTDTYQEAFELLSDGQYDAVLAQSLVGEELIKQLNITNVHAATKKSLDGITNIRTNLEEFEQKFCFAVMEGDKELLSLLNEGLAIIISNGTFDEIYNNGFLQIS